MRNFQDTFKTRKRSFISAFSTCMTLPLSKKMLLNLLPKNPRVHISSFISLPFVNFMLHSQPEGNLNNDQLHLIRIRSQNLARTWVPGLVRLYPLSLIGKVVSQLNAPCSWFRPLRRCGGVLSYHNRFCCYFVNVLILLFILLTLSFGWCRYSLSWFIFFSPKSFDICENSYPITAISEKNGIARPPNYVDWDISFLSCFEQFIPPVISGINYAVITSSNRLKWLDMLGMVLIQNVGLCLNPATPSINVKYLNVLHHKRTQKQLWH